MQDLPYGKAELCTCGFHFGLKADATRSHHIVGREVLLVMCQMLRSLDRRWRKTSGGEAVVVGAGLRARGGKAIARGWCVVVWRIEGVGGASGWTIYMGRVGVGVLL